MADNTRINPGVSGDLIATDDIGGVKHQRVKMEYGADGSATDVSDVSPMPTKQYSVTGAPTSVASSATTVTLLAANGLRRGATIWNNSTAVLYVNFGATASATACVVKMVADAYYEVPYGYTGAISGIWASANGFARVVEVT